MLFIQFDLSDFHLSFTWDGIDQEAAEVIAAARDAAHHEGYSETAWMQSCVIHAPGLLRDQSLHEIVLDGITAFVLQTDTQDAEHPGRVGDYLGAYDLTVVFTNLDHGRIVYHLEAEAKIAGSA